MKQENNNVPLYKRLNSERTQGNWECTLNYIGVPLIRITHFNGSEDLQKDDANAEYTALAVNNLHLLAEALEAIINCAFTSTSNTVEIGKSELKAAKEALKAIS